jgi:hypothetical protein
MAIFPGQGHQQKKQLERRVKQVSYKRRIIFVALHKNVATFKFSTYSKKKTTAQTGFWNNKTRTMNSYLGDKTTS